MAQVKVQSGDGFRTTLSVGDITWVADAPIADGGTETGPDPEQMLFGALGACAAITVRMYAKRKGWPLEGVDIVVEHEKFKKADYPAYKGESDVVNELRQVIKFHGPLTDDQKLRLLEIAGKCPVHRILTQPNFLMEELLRDLDIDAVEADETAQS